MWWGSVLSLWEGNLNLLCPWRPATEKTGLKTPTATATLLCLQVFICNAVKHGISGYHVFRICQYLIIVYGKHFHVTLDSSPSSYEFHKNKLPLHKIHHTRAFCFVFCLLLVCYSHVTCMALIGPTLSYAGLEVTEFSKKTSRERWNFPKKNTVGLQLQKYHWPRTALGSNLLAWGNLFSQDDLRM